MSKILKSFLVFILSATCLICTGLCVGCASSDDGSGGTAGLDYYLLDDGTYGVRIGTMTEISTIKIAAKYGGKPVSTILESGFAGGKVKEITIPSSVVTINKNAFTNCKNLQTVTIPDGVEVIANNTFSGCKSLKSVTFGIGVKQIGNYAFAGCALTSLIIPDGVETIGDYAFGECAALGSVTVGSGVTSIGECAFSNCGRLSTLQWNAVDCAKAGEYNGNIFENSYISNIVIGSGVETIPSYAFAGCGSVNSVSIPDGLICVKSSAFYKCSPKIVNYTGSEEEWAKIDIEEYGNSTFLNATINFNADDPNEEDDRTAKFTFYNAGGWFALQKVEEYTGVPLTSLVIPETHNKLEVKAIGQNACMMLQNLESVVIPKTVTQIDYQAFAFCSKLKTIIFTGTTAEWEAVSKGVWWAYGTEANIVQCSDGTVKK